MSRKLLRIAFLILSAVLGWTLGYIRLPYIERNDLFWLGFIACLVLIGFLIAVYWEWNNNPSFKNLETGTSNSTTFKIYRLFNNKFLIAFVVLLFACVFFWLINNNSNEKLRIANAELNDMKFNANQEQQKNKISLLLELLNTLDSTNLEVQDKQDRDKLIARIAALSSSLKIHKVWDLENNQFQNLSTERGLLLLALLKTKMDSNYFNIIKQNISFHGADLRNADFQNLDMSGVDLKYSNLEYANLQAANFNNANLNGASLVGANLNKATLVGANLISAKLNWAKLNDANLQMSKLDSTDFSNAIIRNSKLNHASMIHTIISNANLNESDLNNTVMMYTKLANTNLTNAILVNADIYFADFETTILNDAFIHPDWIARLKEKENVGLDVILNKYEFRCDSTVIADSTICRLLPKF